MRTTKNETAGRELLVMGILNLNRDSFFAGSRCPGLPLLEQRLEGMLADGADILDLGACSTRPGSEPVSPEAEWTALETALKWMSARYGGAPAALSIDTFRSEIVRRAFDLIGPFTVNDISAGEDDPQMLRTVGELHLPYIAMHKRGTPATMQQCCDYPGGVVEEVLRYFSRFGELAARHGIAEYAVDPGFGFAKTVEQNYRLLAGLPRLKQLGRPVLAGLSRKSMIWKPLGITPEQALCGTAALNLQALMLGADILRVHDVKEAVQCRTLYRQLAPFS